MQLLHSCCWDPSKRSKDEPALRSQQFDYRDYPSSRLNAAIVSHSLSWVYSNNRASRLLQPFQQHCSDLLAHNRGRDIFFCHLLNNDKYVHVRSNLKFSCGILFRCGDLDRWVPHLDVLLECGCLTLDVQRRTSVLFASHYFNINSDPKHLIARSTVFL